MNEQEIVRKVQAGDREAFDALMRTHIRALRVYLMMRVPIPALVDDIAQKAFVEAYFCMDRFDAEKPFAPWLRGIAWKVLCGEAKRYEKEKKHHLKYAEQRVLETYALDEQPSPLLEHLMHCLRVLPPRQSELMALKYGQSCSSADIANRLKQTVSWVNTTVFRVRDTLRRCVEERSLSVRA